MITIYIWRPFIMYYNFARYNQHGFLWEPCDTQPRVDTSVPHFIQLWTRQTGFTISKEVLRLQACFNIL